MSAASRQLANNIFEQAMKACTVEAACARLLGVERNVLHAGEHAFDLARFCDLQIVSAGKAGATLFDAVRPLLPSSLRVRSVISAPAEPSTLGANDFYFRGGHPLPDRNSFAAAAAALELLGEATEHTLVLFLISGGASAMLEQPLDAAVPFDDLVILYRQLLGCGLSIEQVNTVRKHLSAVKGGRLAVAATAATKLSLLVSDVPAHALDSLASGPTLPDASTLDEARKLVQQVLPDLPRPIRLALETAQESPKPTHPAFARATHLVLLDNAGLLSAAREAAERMGFAVTIDNTCDDWAYDRAANYLLHRAKELFSKGAAQCLLSGGEVTVQLPADAGTGGRNQQLALYAAMHLPEGVTLLSAGSDGIDGSSPAAGAVVDGTTGIRARALGLDPWQSLAGFDSGTLFDTLGDALLTGPSGNNLRDLRIMVPDVSKFLTGPPCAHDEIRAIPEPPPSAEG